MITKFKIFETVNTRPTVGDYVILDSSIYIGDISKRTDIGKIGQITEETKLRFIVNFGHRIIATYQLDEFKYWSSDKKELELILQANKYNL